MVSDVSEGRSAFIFKDLQFRNLENLFSSLERSGTGYSVSSDIFRKNEGQPEIRWIISENEMNGE
jgi:hypothetical protein